ncbi:MAG: hypothetical protein JO232_21970 [Verrucomicrobia bacterium]|jgi:hypothetical protein|nr:hypothetical protein [Verrucomicrobiota bacterium]
MVEHQQKPKKSGPMIVIGLLMLLVFGGFAILLNWQGQSIPGVEEAKAEARLKTLADLNADNQRILTQYRWIDKTKGVVGIPIDRAMELVLPELQANKPHAAGPVNLPAAPNPQASPAPSPASPNAGGQK